MSAPIPRIGVAFPVRAPTGGCRLSLAPRKRRRTPGQALVEFVLVVPFVLVLLIVVGDFARLFATAISVETAARDAAEVAAQEYLRNLPGATPPATYYDGTSSSIHTVAVKTACDELGSLPNAGANCNAIPMLVCVHDGIDPSCSTVYPAGVSVAAQCSSLASGSPTNAQGGSSETSRWIEVRVCYRFSTMLNISQIGPIPMPFGDFYLDRTRVFTVADY